MKIKTLQEHVDEEREKFMEEIGAVPETEVENLSHGDDEYVRITNRSYDGYVLMRLISKKDILPTREEEKEGTDAIARLRRDLDGMKGHVDILRHRIEILEHKADSE